MENPVRMKTFISDISKKEFPEYEKVFAKSIRRNIFDIIQKEYPKFNTKCNISISELNQFRQKYVAHYLISEVGELSILEKDVLKTIENEETISKQIGDELEASHFTYGQRLADKISSFGGSWKFIIIFGTFIFIWMIINIIFLASKAFDPYPFILLNLILSCLAALQAPVIMMSQNRQEEKDRERAKQDYMINLKSELEIRMLHEKIDHLIIHQQEELLNIQQIQIEMMEDIMKQIQNKKA